MYTRGVGRVKWRQKGRCASLWIILNFWNGLGDRGSRFAQGAACNASQQASEQVCTRDDALFSIPTEDEVVVNHIVLRMFRMHAQALQNRPEQVFGSGDNDGAVAVGIGPERFYTKERIAQEGIGVEDKLGGPLRIGEDHPFLAGALHLLKERIVCAAREFRKQRQSVRAGFELQDAVRSNELALLADRKVVEREEVERSRTFKWADVGFTGLHVLLEHDAQILLLEVGHTFVAQPVIEQLC